MNVEKNYEEEGEDERGEKEISGDGGWKRVGDKSN